MIIYHRVYQKGVNSVWTFPDWDREEALNRYMKMKKLLMRNKKEARKHPLIMESVYLDNSGEIGKFVISYKGEEFEEKYERSANDY